MAESINDIAIKLSVDAAGVSKGFRTAAEEARSYKAELDRLVYAVGKSDPVDYNAHVTQYTQATNERLAKEKKAQEEFNAWYRVEADREFQAWYAIEQKKEQAAQARIASERQAALYTHNMQQIIEVRPLPAESESRGIELQNLEEAIRKRYALLDQEQQLIQNQVAMNIRNAQRFQATLEMETAARSQSNVSLQAAIIARYALLDTEDRALRDNAVNTAAANARKAEANQQAHQQELANLRSFIEQKYAILNQEERAVRDNATNVAAAQDRAAANAQQAHAQDLANLRVFIEQKYASLDKEDRAVRDNAANRAAAQTRANADAQRLHEQDLQNLREYITQKYAILNREEAIERMNASNAAEIARLKTTRTKQAQDAANAQRDADFVAYKADLARQEAAGMINAERTARIERARQRDAKRAADDDRVRQLNDWRMQQALMQRAAVDTQLATARMTGGFGGAAMAMGQLSYAAEDFIQVLSMGGGLNMALMSASNNLSMVVRSLAGTSMAMSAVAGLAVPAILIGTNMLIQYLSKEEEQVDAVAEAYKRLHKELDHTQELLDRQMQHRFNMQDIDDLATYAAALAKLRQEIKALAIEEAAAAAIETKLATTRKEIRDSVAGGEIIAAAERRLRAMQESPDLFDQGDIARAMEDVENLTEAYEDLSDAMASGSADQIIQAAELLREEIRNTQELGPNFGGFAKEAEAKLAAILGTEDQTAKLEALRDLMKELALVNGDMADGADAIAKTQENMNRLLRQENQLRQDNIRFQLEATDAQKEAADIQNQLSAFLGIDNSNPMQGMNPDDMSAEQARQSAEFLELMWRNLDRQKKELLDEKQRVTPVGGLEQNTYQAQADAFKQILEATNRQEDPQLTRLIRLQETANNLLEDITGIRIVQ